MSTGAPRGQGLIDDRGVNERCCFVRNLEVPGLQVSVVRPAFDSELPEHIGLACVGALGEDHLWLWAPDEPRSEDQDP